MSRQSTVAKLEERIEYNMSLAREAERQYEILTDQYMNGNIPGPIGKHQAKLQRIYNKSVGAVKRYRQKLAKL